MENVLKHEFVIDGEERMLEFGRRLAAVLEPGDRVMLCGVLGAGKTTLVRGIARGLGFQGRVTSPTFTLVNVYPAEVPIYHLDLYRIGDQPDAVEELEEEYYGDGVMLVEWPMTPEADAETVKIDIFLLENDYDHPRRVVIRMPGSRTALPESLTGEKKT